MSLTMHAVYVVEYTVRSVHHAGVDVHACEMHHARFVHPAVRACGVDAQLSEQILYKFTTIDQ
jgi:hypothetical protein